MSRSDSSGPRTETGQRIIRQDYRGNPSWTITMEEIMAIEEEAIAGYVWERLEATPGFNESIAQGLADIRAGRLHRWSDVKRRTEEGK